MKAFLSALLAGCLWAQTALTNNDIIRMVAEKMEESAILEAIAKGTPGYNMTPPYLDHMQRQGVTQQMIRAMAAAQNGRPFIRDQAMAAESVRPARAIDPRAERPDHFGMVPGTPEGSFSGGLATYLEGPQSPWGAIQLEGGVGFGRYVAAVGSFNRFGEGNSVSSGSASGSRGSHISEFLFGVRVFGSNRSRYTPFVTVLGGFGRTTNSFRISSPILGINQSASRNTPAAGIGGGFDIAGTRSVGFRFEPRITYGRDYGWMMHANFGVYFRGGR